MDANLIVISGELKIHAIRIQKEILKENPNMGMRELNLEHNKRMLLINKKYWKNIDLGKMIEEK